MFLNLHKQNIIWKHEQIENIIFLYGFKTPTHRLYSVVLTIIIKEEGGYIHGFLSQMILKPNDLWGIWNYIREHIKINYLIFEVLPEHAKIYKKYLPIQDIKNTISFDGLECELLTVKLGA